MEIKQVKPINFLFFRAETRVNELNQFLPVAQELYREAVSCDVKITGPVHWHYFGFHGDASKPFTLEIALPVAEVRDHYDGKFHFKRSDPFKCVSVVHEGSWYDLPKSYGQLMQYIAANKLQPVAVNREIYINTDLKYPEANITEVQIGVK